MSRSAAQTWIRAGFKVFSEKVNPPKKRNTQIMIDEEQGRSELDRMVARIEQYRIATGLTHIQFAMRHADFVGSHKTWEFRLVARDWSQIKLKTWLPKLRRFILQLDGASTEQEVFASLPIVKHAEYLYATLQSRTNDRRCAMLIGTQGTGKTMALRHVQQHNATNVFLSANETWKDSRMRIATALAQSAGATIAPSASQTFHNALELLKASPITILIDEAHEGGVLLMKLVKTIINDTHCKVIMSIYPTAWARLINGANDAYSEAQQLLRRTWRPVSSDWINGLQVADVQAWASAVKLPELKARAEEFLPRLRKHGNYSLLTDALDRARLIADETDDDLTAADVMNQINELCGVPKLKK